jgi:hypothetical protein
MFELEPVFWANRKEVGMMIAHGANKPSVPGWGARAFPSPAVVADLTYRMLAVGSCYESTLTA